jgi:hypothetical protein
MKNIPIRLRILRLVAIARMPRKPLKHPLYNKILLFARRHNYHYETLNNRQIILDLKGQKVWLRPEADRCLCFTNRLKCTLDIVVDGSLSILFTKLHRQGVIAMPAVKALAA